MSDHEHNHDETHDHEHHDHSHDDHHDHSHNHDHDHDDDHEHTHSGVRGLLTDLFRPHSHDAADSLDDALAGSAEGIRAVKLSLLGLGATAAVQLVVVMVSGSTALLADTIHNFADAATALPLWLAFTLSRRPPNRRYTYGFGRAEDLAGVFVVLVITLSAVLAGWAAVGRLLNPQPVRNL